MEHRHKCCVARPNRSVEYKACFIFVISLLLIILIHIWNKEERKKEIKMGDSHTHDVCTMYVNCVVHVYSGLMHSCLLQFLNRRRVVTSSPTSFSCVYSITKCSCVNVCCTHCIDTLMSESVSDVLVLFRFDIRRNIVRT